MLTLNRNQVREVDRRAIAQYGLSGLVLMENAGRGVADVLCSLAGDAAVAICCGKGNNGGDGFVVARHLDLRGVRVRVLLLADPHELTGDAATNFYVLQQCGVPILEFGGALDPAGSPSFSAELDQADWIVDALLGTGATGRPRPPYDWVIARINAFGKPVLAVDLPSGLDCDTGVAGEPTIVAAHTCTFVAAKPGFFVPGTERFVGELHVLDIGAPRKLVEEVAAAGR